jgi:toxin-antitoxin system PIN domain toxin
MSDPVRLLDVNVLIALTNTNHVHHGRVHAWFADIDRWATTPMTQSSFLRLMLNPAVAGYRVQACDALSILRGLTELAGHELWNDDTSLVNPNIDIAGLVGHQQVTDFHLVNLAARHRGVLATFDRAILSVLIPSDHAYIELI